MPDDPDRVVELGDAEDAGAVVAAERGVATWTERLPVLGHRDVADPLAVQQVDVAIGPLEGAVVVEMQPLGDQQVAVRRQAQRHVRVGDVGVAPRGRGKREHRHHCRERGESPPGDHQAGPGERLTCGVASAAAGASKNSRR